MPFSFATLDRGPLPVFLAVLVVALAARVELPMVPVPMSLQTLAVLLAGAWLGPGRGALALALYLAAGAAGLPAFAGGAAGPAHLLGPTAGYLGGFVAAAALVGWAARRGVTARFGGAVAAGLVGHGLVLGLGTAVLVGFVDGPAAAATAGLWPFLPGALAKSLAFAAILRVLPSPHRAPPRVPHGEEPRIR
jgi:biotin transport system substrate-specific component